MYMCLNARVYVVSKSTPVPQTCIMFNQPMGTTILEKRYSKPKISDQNKRLDGPSVNMLFKLWKWFAGVTNVLIN